VRRGRVVSVTDSGHGDDHIPHGSGDVIEGNLHFSLEESELVTHHQKGDQDGNPEHHVWVLLDQRLQRKVVVRVTAINCAHSLSSCFSVGRCPQQSSEQEDKSKHNAPAEEPVIPLEFCIRVFLIGSSKEITSKGLLFVNNIVETGVGHDEHEEDFDYHYFEHPRVEEVVQVRIYFLRLQPSD
jgi:hypothetical protein